MCPQNTAAVWERFWAKVDKNGPTSAERPELGPCWVWTAAVANNYGQFYTGGPKRLVRPHRFLYEATYGPVSADLHVDHVCRNKLCVNPCHLEAVTQAVNLSRRRFKVKTHCPQGHEYTSENTGRHSAGFRFCRACKRESNARYYLAVERDRRRERQL